MTGYSRSSCFKTCAEFNSSDLGHVYAPAKAAVDGLLELGGDHVANVKKNIEAAANQLVDQLHKGKGKTASTPPPSDVPSTPTLQPSMTPPSSTTPAALLPSTLTLTATPARGVATETVTLLVTLRSGAPGMPPLAGKTISVDFGDGSRKRRQLLAATVTTDANGQATFTHAYLTAQTYNVTAHFAGNATFMNASASLSLVVGLESTTISLAVTPNFLKPLYNASHIVALQFGDATYAASLATAAQVVVRPCSAACSGYDHACAFRLNGTLECFGSNQYGAINVPAQNVGFTGVSFGGSDTTLICFGNAPGFAYPSQPETGIIAVSCGDCQTAALRLKDVQPLPGFGAPCLFQ
ncbi:hypothetical protein WJX75_000753 [Coccomyxa subellipsoidea]|uniref:Bacterial Ig-like domain-containing protein n=1 Tax=Coccomyxa subellipsoidea TaxID=248742 RepID=A0ABR2YLR1_9CHLO